MGVSPATIDVIKRLCERCQHKRETPIAGKRMPLVTCAPDRREALGDRAVRATAGRMAALVLAGATECMDFACSEKPI